MTLGRRVRLDGGYRAAADGVFMAGQHRCPIRKEECHEVRDLLWLRRPSGMPPSESTSLDKAAYRSPPSLPAMRCINASAAPVRTKPGATLTTRTMPSMAPSHAASATATTPSGPDMSAAMNPMPSSRSSGRDRAAVKTPAPSLAKVATIAAPTPIIHTGRRTPSACADAGVVETIGSAVAAPSSILPRAPAGHGAGGINACQNSRARRSGGTSC